MIQFDRYSMTHIVPTKLEVTIIFNTTNFVAISIDKKIIPNNIFFKQRCPSPGINIERIKGNV